MLQLKFQLPQKNRVPELDGLRGVAILAVLFYHFFNFYPFNYLSAFGWVGVDLFFVLSGFLITGILLQLKGSKNAFQVFYVRRALRIMPLYYLALASVFLLVAFDFFNELKYVYDNQVFFWTYTQNILFSFNGFPEIRIGSALNHFWSLAIEEQFYLLWPLVIFLNKPQRILAISFILIGSCILLRNINNEYPFYYIFSFARIDALLIGSIVAILLNYYATLLQKILLPLFFLSLLILISILSFTNDASIYNPYLYRVGYTIIDLIFGCIIIFCFCINKSFAPLKKALQQRTLNFFGKYSYGLYVYHYIFRNLLNLDGFSISNSSMLNNCFRSFIHIGITLIISLLSYHFFEKYFLKLKERFSEKRIFPQAKLHH